jgi:1-acyl-sn-glycerol-3-phosphate acyltransferase
MLRRYRHGDEDRLDLQDPRSIDRWLVVLAGLRRYFSYEVSGIEHVPSSGPALLALNHGPFPVDAPLLGGAIYERFGRLPRALTDHLVFRLPMLREVFMALGAVDGRHDLADKLLDRGNLVIVMPGGAPEAFKPTARAYQLYWRERTGFAKLAIRKQVPILPAACIGIDELYTVPVDMFELGKRVLGVRSLPLPFAWGLGPLPRPVPLRHFIGAPIHPEVPAEAADDEAAVLAFRDRVTDAMESLIASGLRAREGAP